MQFFISLYKVYLYGIYARESFRPSDRWVIDMGLRYDEVRFDITGTRTEEYSYAMGRYVPAGDPGDIDKRFSDISPRLGINYSLTENLNLYTNVAKGIQTPTESEISENPDLELVEVLNYEAGVKARYRRFDFDAAVYYSPVDNEVVQRCRKTPRGKRSTNRRRRSISLSAAPTGSKEGTPCVTKT